MTDLRNVLTAIVPTRNRPELFASLTRFLGQRGSSCPLIVADSSDLPQAAQNESASRVLSNGQYRHYAPSISVFDKLLDCLNLVKSPFVVMLPDDDIPLPHALEQCTAFLSENQDYAAAWGYVVDFAMHGNDIDLFRVRWFTPSIDEQNPFERVYHLVRRYQPFFWGVFRTDVLIRSLDEARGVERLLFQEMTTTLTAALQGKIARLPVIYALRGEEPPSGDRAKVEPLIAFIDDAAAFFRDYVNYRDKMSSFARRHLGEGSLNQLHDCTIEHFLDLVHGIGLARELDAGTLNYTVQRALGAPHPPIPFQKERPGWRKTSSTDLIHPSRVPGRRYIWREDVLNAEPRAEITISQEEMARVESQIENYLY